MSVADFFLDADIAPELGRQLERQGHSVRTTRQESQLDASDDVQLLVATNLGRFLITHNERDFILLSRAWRSFARQWNVTPADHAAIIAVPQSRHLPHWRAATEIDSLVRTQHHVWGHLFSYSLKWGWILDP